MKLENTCLTSLSGSVLSIAWAENISSIVGLIGTIISAVFGLISLIILLYTKLKKKSEDGLTPFELLDIIKEGKKEAEPFINELKEAIEEYQNKQK